MCREICGDFADVRRFCGRHGRGNVRKAGRNMRILIVEDNRRLAESLRDILKSRRYEADVTLDGEEGLELLTGGSYDGVILDVMLPGMDGFTLLRKARERGCKIPVLILTARSETEDKVRGLESGADYYLTKPFDKDELLAALKAVLRRGGELIPDVLSFGDICLNQSTYCLEKGERSIRLGKREYEVLRILMSARGSIVSKETMIVKIWGDEGEAVDNNVEIYISFLRKKLNFLKAKTAIVTARHLGYYLRQGESL